MVEIARTLLGAETCATKQTVTPAKAGVSGTCAPTPKIPAFAGMTVDYGVDERV